MYIFLETLREPWLFVETNIYSVQTSENLDLSKYAVR